MFLTFPAPNAETEAITVKTTGLTFTEEMAMFLKYVPPLLSQKIQFRQVRFRCRGMGCALSNSSTKTWGQTKDSTKSNARLLKQPRKNTTNNAYLLSYTGRRVQEKPGCR